MEERKGRGGKRWRGILRSDECDDDDCGEDGLGEL